MDGKINVRIPNEDILKFKRRCDKINRPYQVMLREIVTAFNENRLVIKQNPEHKDLYE